MRGWQPKRLLRRNPVLAPLALPNPAPLPAPTRPTPPLLDVSSTAMRAVAITKQYLGTPFVWGGETPEVGFDSAGLTRFTYHQVGVELPRVASDQFHVGAHVDALDVLPGDLVFFQDATGYVHHVGIYVEGGTFIHAPHTGDVVKYSTLAEAYYYIKFAGAKRVAA